MFTTDGAATRGFMYHAESLYETGTAEDIADEFNDERRFIAFHPEEESAGVSLINKRHIVRVRVLDLTEADLRPANAEDAHHVDSCTLWLVDGSSVTGRPVVETPAESSRLLDKFNHSSTFLTFVTDDGVDFVQAAHIVKIVGSE
jgi:hypothetical protein